LTNCLSGAKDCDVFIGFIRPDYGSGVLEKGGKSITHQEFEIATARKIPWFILADYRVTFTRSILRNAQVKIGDCSISIAPSNVNFNPKVMDIRCVQLYNQMVKDIETPTARIGNWIQEYSTLNDIRLFLESQFKYPKRIQDLMKKMKPQQ